MAINSEKNFDITNLTTFKIGGHVDTVYFPDDIEDFRLILEQNPGINVFGNLSNTLISSDGYRGKIILTGEMNSILIDGTRVIADCGVKGPKLAQEVCRAGLSGLEFMIGFPGSVGGEVFMNASAHGQCISDRLVSVICYSPSEGIVKYSKDEMEFEYRKSRCERDNLVVLQVKFDLEKANCDEIQAKMDENLKFRKNHQPSLALPNCGSIFKNPPCANPAGKLLESVGAKFLMIGGARVWRNHSNFIINTGNATSFDVINLMTELKERVEGEFGINLEPELKFLSSNKEEIKAWNKLIQK